jgi:hypothetical protein
MVMGAMLPRLNCVTFNSLRDSIYIILKAKVEASLLDPRLYVAPWRHTGVSAMHIYVGML